MADSLSEVKRRLSAKYLGQGRIHGVGIREKQSAIRVYLEEDDSPEQQEVLKSLTADAAPFPVLVTDAPRASV